MSHSVYWYDGMYFWPHHMQAEDRFRFEQLARGQQFNLHHNWGVRLLDIDSDALAEARFVVRGLQARLPGGALIDVPAGGSVPALDLKEHLAKKASVLVSVAVPSLRLGKRNAAPWPPDSTAPAEETPPEPVRYQVTAVEVEDENTGDGAQPIPVRMFNLRLLPETESTAGYDVLPLARVRLASADGVPELDRTYFPPALTCDAWPPLQADILQVSYDRIGRKLERLGTEVVTRGISFDTRHFGAPKRLHQLQVLNEAFAVLRQVAFVAGVHPLPAYVELCRIVGKLAVFGPTREVPPLPAYDHDDLGGCFFRVKQYLDALLEEVAEPEYEQRPFVGERLRMQVALKPEWLQPMWRMFVGVRSTLDPAECVRMLTKSNLLDMKIGSGARVDEIFDRGELGLRFTHTSQLPQALPAEPGLIYFQIARESQKDEWKNVEQTLTLAIRLNQNRIVGDIHGKRSVSIQAGGQAVPMEFTLYLVAEEPA